MNRRGGCTLFDFVIVRVGKIFGLSMGPVDDQLDPSRMQPPECGVIYRGDCAALRSTAADCCMHIESKLQQSQQQWQFRLNLSSEETAPLLGRADLGRADLECVLTPVLLPVTARLAQHTQRHTSSTKAAVVYTVRHDIAGRRRTQRRRQTSRLPFTRLSR